MKYDFVEVIEFSKPDKFSFVREEYDSLGNLVATSSCSGNIELNFRTDKQKKSRKHVGAVSGRGKAAERSISSLFRFFGAPSGDNVEIIYNFAEDIRVDVVRTSGQNDKDYQKTVDRYTKSMEKKVPERVVLDIIKGSTTLRLMPKKTFSKDSEK